MMRLLFLLFIILHFQHCLSLTTYEINCCGLKAAVIEKELGNFVLYLYTGFKLWKGKYYNTLDLKDVTVEKGKINFKFKDTYDETSNTLQTWKILSTVNGQAPQQFFYKATCPISSKNNRKLSCISSSTKTKKYHSYNHLAIQRKIVRKD